MHRSTTWSTPLPRSHARLRARRGHTFAEDRACAIVACAHAEAFLSGMRNAPRLARNKTISAERDPSAQSFLREDERTPMLGLKSGVPNLSETKLRERPCSTWRQPRGTRPKLFVRPTSLRHDQPPRWERRALVMRVSGRSRPARTEHGEAAERMPSHRFSHRFAGGGWRRLTGRRSLPEPIRVGLMLAKA